MKDVNESEHNIVKTFIALLVLLGLLIAGIALNWNFFRPLFINQVTISQSTQPSSQKESKPTDTSNPTVSLGTQTIKVVPGLTKDKQFLLPDGESRITFGNTGRPDSVPDLVFGNNKVLNDIHSINYLPVRNDVSFYNNGYFIELKNLGCNTETRFTDVPEVWVTDCSVQVTSKQEEAPVRNLEPFTKTISTTESFNNRINSDLNTPFIYVAMPELKVQNFSTPFSSENVSLSSGTPPNRSTSFWDISVITSYGTETIRYTAQEIWDKETKQVVTGPLTAVSTIDNLDCKVIFTGDEGQQTERCDVTASFSFSQDETKLVPIKIYSYTQ